MGEFIVGLEELGFFFTIQELKLLFNMLDKEGTKLVNFEKFCRLNSGKNLKLAPRRNLTEVIHPAMRGSSA